MLKDCDWIVEAVIERLDIKQALYKKIDAHRKKGSIVSSNTSTIPLKDLTSDMPASLVPDFIITHFFNPPRYMRLLEIVGSDKTRPEVMDTLHHFGDVRLGKGVVRCKAACECSLELILVQPRAKHHLLSASTSTITTAV